MKKAVNKYDRFGPTTKDGLPTVVPGYAQYEVLKRAIQDQKPDPKEYERLIKKAAREAGV